MVNKNYQSGRAFEYRVKEFLEQHGFFVMRSAGSKGKIDLVAIPMFRPPTFVDYNYESLLLLVQCKHGSKISKPEREGLLELEKQIGIPAKTMCAWSKKGGSLVFFTWIGNTWSEVQIG